MATLRELPTVYLQLSLLLNPKAVSFPWGIAGIGPDVPRAAVLAELQARPDLDNRIYSVPQSSGLATSHPIVGKSSVK